LEETRHICSPQPIFGRERGWVVHIIKTDKILEGRTIQDVAVRFERGGGERFPHKTFSRAFGREEEVST
jgi:hypothetical protein